MKWFFAVLAFFFILYATSGEAVEPVQLADVSVDYFKFGAWSRDALFDAGHTMGSELDLNLNLDLFKLGFFDSQVHSQTDQSQFHVVGLRYRLGVHLGSLFDVYIGHASTHTLDTEVPGGAYPEQDYGGITIHLYRGK